MGPLVNSPQIKDERQNKEQDRRIDGSLAQDVARVCAERGLSHSAAHRCAQSAIVLRLLHQHDEDQKNRSHDQDERENTEENVHVKGSKNQSQRSFVNASEDSLEGAAEARKMRSEVTTKYANHTK